MASSAVFGILLVWVSAPMVRRGTERIDRAFFRSAYDARHILEDLVAKARTVQTRETLVHLLADHIRQALQPATLVVYLSGPANHLVLIGGPASPELQPLPRDLPLLMELARQGQPWEVGVEAGTRSASRDLSSHGSEWRQRSLVGAGGGCREQAGGD
jgi:hypothetical protein